MIYDLGCGAGIITAAALNLGAGKVIVSDISQRQILNTWLNVKRLEAKGKVLKEFSISQRDGLSGFGREKSTEGGTASLRRSKRLTRDVSELKKIIEKHNELIKKDIEELKKQ